MKSQREAFEKQYCENSGITVSEYRKEYVTLPCQCPEEDCPGWAVVRATPLSIKTHVDLYAPDWQAATEQGVGEAVGFVTECIGNKIGEGPVRAILNRKAAFTLPPDTKLYAHPRKPTGGGVPDGWTFKKQRDSILVQFHENREFIKGRWIDKSDDPFIFDALSALLATQQPPEQK